MHAGPCVFSRWLLRASLSLVLVLAAGFSALAGHKRTTSDEDRKSPRVVLSATPAFGFSPLNVQLVAILTGVDAHDPNFCHAGVTWIRVDPGSQPETGTRVSEAPRCLHGEEEVSVATSFNKSFDLYNPGAYLYRIVIDGKDGTQLRSNFVKVQVMRVP